MVERRSPKPQAAGSSPAPSAKLSIVMIIKNNHITTNTIVVFSSNAGNHVDNINPSEFLHSLSNFSARLVFVSDSSKKWYRNGIDESSGFADSINILKKVIDGRVLFMGHSAGGYAAMLFGSLIGVDSVLAFSPQTKVSDDWSGFIPHDDFYDIIKGSVCEITIVYCERYVKDFEHIKQFFGRAKIQRLNCDHHNSARYATKKSNFLQQYIENFIMETPKGVVRGLENHEDREVV